MFLTIFSKGTSIYMVDQLCKEKETKNHKEAKIQRYGIRLPHSMKETKEIVAENKTPFEWTQ